MTLDPPRAALIYARISQDREGAGLGVDRQIQDCVQLAERLGWTVVSTHRDDDTSAYSGKARPGYKQLLADLKAGKATGVLVWHTDRLHRSSRELESYIDVSEAHGVITHSVQAGPLDLSTPTGRMQARIVGAVAQHESEHRSERVRRASQQRAEAGRYHGGSRAFGYESDGITQRPAEAAVIREAIEQTLAGTSLRAVVRKANSSGLLTPFRRESWSIIAFRTMLLRGRNAGLREHRGEVIGKAEWAGIVPEDQWRAAVAILSDPARKTSPSNRVKWLGSGLYICGPCGQPSLRVQTAGSKRVAAYRCREGGGGHVVRVAPPLDDFIESVIVGRLSRPDAVELLRPRTPDVDLDALRSDSTAAREHLREIAEMFGDGEMTRAQFAVAQERAQRRLDRAEAALTEATVPSALDGLVGIPDVARAWSALDLGRKRAVLSTLMLVTIVPAPVKGGPFNPDGVRIDWH